MIERAHLLLFEQNRPDLAERQLLSDPFILEHLSLAKAMLGHCRFRQGDMPGARKWLEEALQADPEQMLTCYWLALVELNEQRLSDAERLARETVRLGPDNPDGYDMLAIVAFVLGNFGFGFEMSEVAVGLSQNHPHHLCTKAAGYVLSGQHDKAASLLRAVLQIDPQFARAHYLLSLGKLDAKDFRAAALHLNTALGIEPTQAAFHDHGRRIARMRIRFFVSLAAIVILIPTVLTGIFLLARLLLNSKP
ncbi:MAG: tetratricopeptide repeat protein [Planctomycetes bacterium]|nr:tetratricopeptide repeat protein [Planctomycetota bacterium]